MRGPNHRGGGGDVASLVEQVRCGRLGRGEVLDRRRPVRDRITIFFAREVEFAPHDHLALTTLLEAHGVPPLVPGLIEDAVQGYPGNPPGEILRDAVLDMIAVVGDEAVRLRCTGREPSPVFALSRAAHAAPGPDAHAQALDDCAAALRLVLARTAGVPRYADASPAFERRQYRRAARMYRFLAPAPGTPEHDRYRTAVHLCGDPEVIAGDLASLQTGGIAATLSPAAQQSIQACSAREAREERRENLRLFAESVRLSRRLVEISRRSAGALDRVGACRVDFNSLAEKPNETLADHVCDEALRRTLEAIAASAGRPERASAAAGGGTGLLLHGGYGVGKSHLARCFAGELRRPLLRIDHSTIADPLFGRAERVLADLARRVVRELDGRVVLLLDELEATAPAHPSEFDGHRSALFRHILLFLDSVLAHPAVLAMGATNRESAVHPAVRRAGRLSWDVRLEPPTPELRRRLFEKYLAPVFDGHLPGLDAAVDREYTPAEIAAIARRVAIVAGDREAAEMDFQRVLREFPPGDISRFRRQKLGETG